MMILDMSWSCSVFFFTYIFSTSVTLGQKSITFEIIKTSSIKTDKSNRLRCAASVIRNNSLIGVRLRAEDNMCESLEFSWFGESLFESGFEYLLKQESDEIFSKPVRSLTF